MTRLEQIARRQRRLMLSSLLFTCVTISAIVASAIFFL
jgi:hypothetical protein